MSKELMVIFDEIFNNIETEIIFRNEWMENLSSVICGQHATRVSKDGAVKTTDLHETKLVIINDGETTVMITCDGFYLYSFEAIVSKGITYCRRTKLTKTEFHYFAARTAGFKSIARNQTMEAIEKALQKSKLSPK